MSVTLLEELRCLLVPKREATRHYRLLETSYSDVVLFGVNQISQYGSC